MRDLHSALARIMNANRRTERPSSTQMKRQVPEPGPIVGIATRLKTCHGSRMTSDCRPCRTPLDAGDSLFRLSGLPSRLEAPSLWVLDRVPERILNVPSLPNSARPTVHAPPLVLGCQIHHAPTTRTAAHSARHSVHSLRRSSAIRCGASHYLCAFHWCRLSKSLNETPRHSTVTGDTSDD